jgi:hypothetical protein
MPMSNLSAEQNKIQLIHNVLHIIMFSDSLRWINLDMEETRGFSRRSNSVMRK